MQPSVFLFIDRFDQCTYRFRLIQTVGSDSRPSSIVHAPVILDAENNVDANLDKQLHGVLDQVVGDVRARSAMRGEQPSPSADKESGALERLGRLLFTYVLPKSIQSALRELNPDASLILVANDDRYPWEVLHDGNNHISLNHVFCRRTAVPEQIQATRTPTGSVLKILLITNPTGDLPEADEEMMELLDMFDRFEPHVRATSIGVKRATKQKVLEAIASGEYDIIHYSGHARSDALLLADGELSGAELGRALQGTPFFFLNACESAETGLPSEPDDNLALSEMVAADLVMGTIRGGASGVLGTLWPIFDRNSRHFAAYFYSQILRGIPLGEAVRQTRSESAKAFLDDLLWASYVLYGEPTFQWLIPESREMRTVTVLAVNNESLLRQFDGIENEAEIAFQLYDAFEKNVQQHGGQAVRIGRGVLAGHWGVNQVFDDQGVRALRTAERLRIDFDDLLAGSSGNNQSPLKPSFGICTGDAVVRSRQMLIGPQWYSHDYVSGDAVALSERAHEGEILVDKDTHTLVQRVYAFEQIKDDEPKQSIAYRVKGIVDVLPPLIPLIGRESELSDLRKYYADSVAGRGAVVGLTGAAGIGKTRLVQQFYSEHGGDKTLWLKAHCQPSDQTSPYAVLAQFISQLAGFSAQDDRGVRAAKIQQICQQFASDMRQPEASVEECVALLGMAIGISHTNQKSAYTDPETKQRQLVRLVQGLVAHRTQKTPMVLVLEDMQWIDEASLAVFEKLVEAAGQWRLLVLALYRPNWRHNWAQLDFYHHIGLDELSEADSVGFVQTLLGASETPKEVVKAILSFAGGNPFYVEEVVKALLDGGFLQQSVDVWTLTEGWETVANPKSIHNTIRMRVQRLPEPVQKIVGEATVVGQEFEYQLLDEVKGELAETDLGDALDVLSRRRFITLLEGWRSTAFYEFHHGLIWKSIYDDLVQSNKARLHRLVGLALLRLYRDESKRELWMRAVGHFYLGDDRIRAITYCLQFAQESAEVWANQIALHWYSRAIEKIATFDEQLPSADEVSQGATDEQLLSWSVQARIGAADVNAVLDRNDEAIVGYNDALSLLNEMGDGAKEEQAGLYLNIAKACERKGTYADAQRALDSGLRIVSPTDGGNLGQLHVWRGMIHFRLGELQDALDACEMGISYLEQAEGVMIQLAQAYNLRGILYRQLGRFDDAIASYGRSLSVYDQVNHRAGQTRVHNNRGVLLQDMGRWPEALVDFDASLEYSEETGEAWWQAAALLNKGEIYRRQGHLHAAIKVLEEAHEIGDEHNLGEIVGLTLMNLGAVYQREGNLDKAEVKIAEAGRQFEDIQARGHLVEIQRWQTELAMARAQWSEALPMAQEGLEAAQKTGRTLEIAHAYRRLGKIYRHLKRYEEAEQALSESLQRTEQMNTPYEKGLALFELAQLKTMQPHHHAEALAICDEVIVLWSQLGAELDLVSAQVLRSKMTSVEEKE